MSKQTIFSKQHIFSDMCSLDNKWKNNENIGDKSLETPRFWIPSSSHNSKVQT